MLHTLQVSLWFAFFNANRTCSIGYQWGPHRSKVLTRILIAKITKLEKLHENIFKVQNNVGENQWNKFMWSQHKQIKNKFQFGDYVIQFSKGKKHIWANSRKDGLDHLGYNIAYPTTQFFLFMLTILNQTQFW